MATETRNSIRTDVRTSHWRSAIAASLLAAIPMGLILQDVMGIMPLIGDLYGSLGLFTGWTAHLVHSLVFGLVYAAAVNYTSLARYADSAGTGAVLGVAYGVVVWAVAAAFLMPIWLRAVLLDPPAVPNVEPMSLLAHVVFGVVLGAAYAIVRNR